MSQLRSELEVIVAHLLATSAAGGSVTLDAIGDAIGVMAVSVDEIDAVLTALEAEGRTIVGASGPGAEAHLRRVVPAVRELKRTLERRPTVAEVAKQAGITTEEALLALSLLRIMQR